MVNALLDAGAYVDVNQPRRSGDQEFPLHVAAKAGHLDMCSALIGAGADVNCRDRNGWTPLHLAARFGQIEVSPTYFLPGRGGGGGGGGVEMVWARGWGIHGEYGGTTRELYSAEWAGA